MKNIILTALWPFKLSYFGQLSCIIGYGVCVINSFHNFHWIIFKTSYIFWGNVAGVQLAF